MNCQDIARTLDSRNVNGLSATERRACEAHAMSCPQCAPTWVVYTRLAAIPVPPMPPEFAAQCETLAATQGRVTHPGRAPRRMVLIGAVLVVAAAAAMLSLQMLNRQPVAPVAQAAPAATPVTSVDNTLAATSPGPAADEPLPHEEKAEPIDAAVATLTVRVLPLRNEIANPAGRTAVASMYTAFLERLRAVPGVTLLAADAAAGSPVANYRITITGEEGYWGTGSDHQFGGEFKTEILLPSGTVRAGTYGSYKVEAAPGCATNPRAADLEVGMTTCSDPEGVAAQLVGQLRKSEFPPDPALRRELQARLLDRSLDVLQRWQAFGDLARFGGGYGGAKTFTEPNQNLRDPAVIRGAIDLATTASDPKVRTNVWTVLQGTGNTSLISPLIAALSRDADSEVRLTALKALAGDFAADPRVKAAFTVAAMQDTRPLVRALAHRAAGGADAETEWKQYVVASLKDPRRPAVERIEALFNQMDLGATSHPFRNDGSAILPALDMLDDEAIRMLAVALPAAAAESPIVQVSAYQLLGNLGVARRPAVTELLLDILDSGTTSLSRENTTELLGERANDQNDAHAYAMLEKLSASDPDPRVRQTAALALQARSSKPPAGTQRLGITFTAMERGPGVPDYMVGRPLVKGVGPGTVAQKAGLREQDVLLEINGKPVPGDAELLRMVEDLPKGVDIDLLVSRSGRNTQLIARF